uniref:CYP5680A1 protein n=1 Tax=Euplotes crassus TaxID=5936 RepID=A0A1S5RRT7_EUPCR|nr:CYP5680A1 protein [Moneuplotes crassus]
MDNLKEGFKLFFDLIRIPVIVFFLYVVYYICNRLFLHPYLFKRKYKKYPNVYVDPEYKLMMGEIDTYLKNQAQNKVFYSHRKEVAQFMNKYDLSVSLEGIYTGIKVVSPQAMKEFLDLQPGKIDRQPETRGIGQVVPRALMNIRATAEFKEKRKQYLSLLSLNSSSKYLPYMLKTCDGMFQKIPENKYFECNIVLNCLTFSIFSSIVFGEDVQEYLSDPEVRYDYITETRETVQLSFREFFIKTIQSYIVQYYEIYGTVLPFLNTYRIIEPFKTNQKNVTKLYQILEDICQRSSDPKSILKQCENLYDDLVMLMVAGTDTSSHVLCSLIYFLEKYQIKDKLREELKTKGLDKGIKLEDITSDKVQEVDYLNYVIKETMRMDTPTIDSFGYQAYEDITICGVPISKGTLVRPDFTSAHFSPDEWHSPMEFIPERFDPESKYFYKPSQDGKKEARSPYSWLTFSAGVRKCPGQSLAMLEIKVLITYLIINFDYEVDKDLIENDYVGFGLGSHFKLRMKLKKRV